MVNWDQEVESSAGGFFSWGEKPNQSIIGTVIDYNPTGGSDYDGDPCPLLIVELTEQAHSFIHKERRWQPIDAGETVKLTCSQPSLNEVVRLIKPGPNDLIQITLTELAPTNKGNPAKVFKGRVARGAGKTVPAANSGGPASFPPGIPDDDDDSEPPF